MNVDRERLLAKARQWVAYADEDLTLARYALAMKEPPFRLVAYHAQQCVEKYFKGCLVCLGVDFPYTHNIARLRELFVENRLDSEALRQSEQLSPYAVTARYPGEDEEVTREEAEHAVRIAVEASRVLRTHLLEMGWRPPTPE